jgi:hypothetical protein
MHPATFFQFFSSHAWNYALQGIEHCLSWMGSHFPSPQGIIPLVGFSFMLSCYATSSLYPYPLQLVICESHLAEIGIGLTGFGVFFSFLGIIFFFDKGLLAMGNILFLSGLGLTIGLKSTLQFFTKPKNYKGTISFGAGLLLVLIGWPFFGMLLEAYGFIVLFSGFWPTLVVFLQKIPFIGWIFQQPFVASYLGSYRGKRVPV